MGMTELYIYVHGMGQSHYRIWAFTISIYTFLIKLAIEFLGEVGFPILCIMNLVYLGVPQKRFASCNLLPSMEMA